MGVETIRGAKYIRVDDDGLHVDIKCKKSAKLERRILPVDHVVLCSGQEPQRSLQAGLEENNMPVFLIGGCNEVCKPWV